MTDIHARRLLVFLVLAALALTVVIVRPFWIALVVAAVVSAALRPAMEWLSGRLRGHRSAAAALLTFGVLVLVVFPIAAFGTLLVNQVVDGIDWIRKIVESEGMRGLVEHLPGFARNAAREVLDAVPQHQQQLQKLLGERGTGAAAAVGGVLAATGTVLFHAAMMLIALFFLLRDGRRLVGWIDAWVPLRRGQFRALLEDFRQTSVTVLVATIGTAAIQTTAAVLGYLVARAPNLLFLALATFLLALVPALGGTAMVAIVAVLFLATGHLVTAAFLGAWAVVVSLADSVARPYLMRGGMELHGGVVFFALLGGLSAFGAIGLLLGPLVLTFLVTALKLYRSEFGAADPPPGSDLG